MNDPVYDLAIIGGGVNGCGIARDAAGRGLSVFLCEQNDLASGTSSASTKLIHGGLRYLEYYEFRLVREALHEREVLLNAAPHIIWPLRFVLPHNKGLRPAWLVRLGLFLYDHLGGRKLLPGTSVVDLRKDKTGEPLQEGFTKGFEYSDCWVMDSRLVVLNAMDARDRGADIRTRTKLIDARRVDGVWELTLQDRQTEKRFTVRSKILINAGGPWLDQLMEHIAHCQTKEHIRMVKGSHIIVKKMYDHDRAYIFQNPDGRIVFAIPYENDFTLIGTTDEDFHGDPDSVCISEAEISYLCEAVSEYFLKSVTPADVVSHFAGIRPLFDDGRSDAKAATRDYILKVDAGEHNDEAPLLSIYGGKITTYRKLAESVLEKISRYTEKIGQQWTESKALPGGDFEPGMFERELEQFQQKYPFIAQTTARRLLRLYGTCVYKMLHNAKTKEDLGEDFGNSLFAVEVEYLIANEWAKSGEDILWRRTKLGLHATAREKEVLEEFVREKIRTG